MVSVVKIGDELSAAALTRGLGGTGKADQIYAGSDFTGRIFLRCCSVPGALQLSSGRASDDCIVSQILQTFLAAVFQRFHMKLFRNAAANFP